MNKLPKLNIKNGWYSIANFEIQLPYRSERLNDVYYWVVYVENGYPVTIRGNKELSIIQNILTSNEEQYAITADPANHDMLLTCEKTWGKTAYQYLIDYGHPVKSTPVLQNGDDIYQLDFS